MAKKDLQQVKRSPVPQSPASQIVQVRGGKRYKGGSEKYANTSLPKESK